MADKKYLDEDGLAEYHELLTDIASEMSFIETAGVAHPFMSSWKYYKMKASQKEWLKIEQGERRIDLDPNSTYALMVLGTPSGNQGANDGKFVLGVFDSDYQVAGITMVYMHADTGYLTADSPVLFSTRANGSIYIGASNLNTDWSVVGKVLPNFKLEIIKVK